METGTRKCRAQFTISSILDAWTGLKRKSYVVNPKCTQSSVDIVHYAVNKMIEFT